MRKGGKRKEEVSVSQSPYDAMISPSLPLSLPQSDKGRTDRGKGRIAANRGIRVQQRGKEGAEGENKK